MSYNLLLEGRVDYDEWAAIAARFGTLEIFPAPANGRGEPDGLGVAIPLQAVRNTPAGVMQDLRRLSEETARARLTAWDLVRGKELASQTDWATTISEVCG